MGSNLLPHYHIHAVVPGGGLSADRQRWIHTSHPMFLLPVPVLRTVFRKKFLAGLCHLYRKDLLNLRGSAAPLRDPASFQQLIHKLGKRNGTSMPSRPSADRNMCSAILAATPIAWLSATTASPPSTGSASASSGAIMPTAAGSAS